MIVTSPEYKDLAGQRSRPDIDVFVKIGEHIISADYDGGLVSVEYNYDSPTAIGGYVLAAVDVSFVSELSERDIRVLLREPVTVHQGFADTDYVSIGPFYTLPETVTVEEQGIVTFTAMDVGQFLDIPYAPLDFEEPLTGSQIVDGILAQANLTRGPGEELPFDSYMFSSINAGYSTDVSLRSLIAQYAQINGAVAVTAGEQVVFKSAVPAPNLIKSDFSDFTAYQGATVTKNKTFPIDVFKGGRNLIKNSGVTKQFTEQVPKLQINSDFDLEQVLTLKCYFKIQLGDLI